MNCAEVMLENSLSRVVWDTNTEDLNNFKSKKLPNFVWMIKGESVYILSDTDFKITVSNHAFWIVGVGSNHISNSVWLHM